MTVRHAMLALLSEGPKYGLRLREEFEDSTGEVWPLNVGQVGSATGDFELLDDGASLAAAVGPLPALLHAPADRTKAHTSTANPIFFATNGIPVESLC